MKMDEPLARMHHRDSLYLQKAVQRQGFNRDSQGRSSFQRVFQSCHSLTKDDARRRGTGLIGKGEWTRLYFMMESRDQRECGYKAKQGEITSMLAETSAQ